MHFLIDFISFQAVMHDYAMKMFDGLKTCKKIQRAVMQFIMLKEGKKDPKVSCINL